MTDKQTFDLKDGHTWVRSAPRVETIVAMKSDEQASLSPGAYEVLTGAVKNRDVVGMLRGLERHGEDNIWRVAQEAREEIEALRTSLAHWKVFGEHAEGERSRLKHNEAVMMDALYKACGDDEEMVRQIIESQGVLRPDPALLASDGA